VIGTIEYEKKHSSQNFKTLSAKAFETMTMTMNTSKAFNINNLSKISAYETIRG
jgi:hypothetical protein